MWSSSINETPEQRHKRLLMGRIMKARILNDRLTQFVNDTKASTIYKDSEKNEIFKELKFLKPL
jgi:hypothetical protein